MGPAMSVVHGALQLHLTDVTIRDVSLILISVQPLPLRQVGAIRLPASLGPPVVHDSFAFSLHLPTWQPQERKGEDIVPNRCSGSGGWRRAW